MNARKAIQLLGGALAGLVLSAGALAAKPVSLIITYHATPQHWSALRNAMAHGMAARLAQDRRSGALENYALYYNRDLDAVTWSGLAVLDFASEAALEHWSAAHAAAPAGLAPSELPLVGSAETAESEPARQDGTAPGSRAARYLVIPYRYTVSEDAYRDYLDGYTIPQLKGWMSAGILTRYAIYLAEFPAGRPWSSLLILRYRDADALAQRDAVKAQVRTQLGNDAAWSKRSASKEHVREELAPAVADLLASGN